MADQGPDRGHVSSKVRAYMEALSPQARAMVLRAARQSRERGELGVPGEVLLRASEGLTIDETLLDRPAAAPVAARAAAGAAAGADRVLPARGEPERGAEGGRSSGRPAVAGPAWRDRVDQSFWAPLEPFLVDQPGPTKQTARIARASAEKIGTWLMRDVAGAEFAVAYAEDPRDPAADVGPCVERLRRAVVVRALAAVREAEDNPKSWQRFVAQIGGDRVVGDLRDVIQIFQRDAAFAGFADQLPRLITALDLDDTGTVPGALRAFAKQEGVDLAFAAALLQSRLSQPHLLALTAIRLTSNADARAVAAGRYGRLIDFLIGEMERRVAVTHQFEAERPSRDRLVTALREHHDVHRQTLLALDLDQVQTWHRRLGALRRDLSALAGRYLEAAPGLIRRALRVESLAGGVFGGGFDRDAFEDAEFALQVFVEVRTSAESLALNELLTRARRDIERTLELVTERLFADLKSPDVFDRDALLGAVDGAIRLCALIFGEEYAGVLRRNRDGGAPRASQRVAG
jgi:hypothetical protein